MIYDCFTFFNEIEILEIRLNTLNDIVDKFVIAEATRTHSNKPKKLFFEENRDRFKKFEDKIIYLVVDEFPEFKNSWTYENYQRNYIAKALVECDEEDIIMISDVDEIPHPDIIHRLKGDGVYCLLQDMYFFFVNYADIKHLIWRGGTKVFRYKELINNRLDESLVKYNEKTFPRSLNKGSTLTKFRLYDGCQYVENGGWHFSYMGGINAIQEKLRSFSHQEFNNSKMLDGKRLQKCLENGEDIFGRHGHKFVIIENKNSLPTYLVNNQVKYLSLFAFSEKVSNIFLRKKLEYALFKSRRYLKKSYNYITK